MRTLLTYGRYLNEKFSAKVFKVPVSISGFTCPNIDGSVSRGGCTFCENDSFSPSLNKAVNLKKFTLNLTSENPYLDMQLEQLELQYRALSSRLKRERGAEKFILYFQSFTNTYAPLSTIKALYSKALSFENVIGLSIGTRSDSVTEEILEYLSELSNEHEIWVEYGIQSVYDSTLERINRGHDSKNTQEWILKSKEYGLNVCGHLIFGLPSESQDMMLHTAKRSFEWGIDSVKFHPLYVVSRTALANEYRAGEFTPISQAEYIDTLLKAIEMMPEHISIQRVSAGVDDDTLIAPQWCRFKESQMSAIRKRLLKEGIRY